MNTYVYPFFVSLLSWTLLAGCFIGKNTTADRAPASDDGLLDVVILHINDVYEIAPLEGGKVGGMARVAALRQQLEREHPNLLFVHAGDFLNPSLLGTLKYEGKRIKGKQMIEVMNAMDIDLVTFGNHEFDLDEDELQERLNESAFEWLGTNVRHLKDGQEQPFQIYQNGTARPALDEYIWEVQDADGTTASIGFFSATLPSNPKPYVQYGDPYKLVQEKAVSLRQRTDVVLGLTHLEEVEDLKLAGMVPFVPLLMGGHDHDHLIDTLGQTIVAKADANVKSVYIHRLRLDKNKGTVALECEWMPITDQLDPDPAIESLVQKWTLIQDEVISQIVDHPYEKIYFAAEPLDGRESTIRNQRTNLGVLIAEAMLAAAPKGAQAAVFNSGSVRIDDQLSGDILAIDLFRALPFGGAIVQVQLKGSLLEKVLHTGQTNKGTGGFLQYAGLEQQSGKWMIMGQPLDPAETYQIAITEFLLTGLETRLDFLTRDNPDILSVSGPEGLNADIRKVVIHYLKSR